MAKLVPCRYPWSVGIDSPWRILVPTSPSTRPKDRPWIEVPICYMQLIWIDQYTDVLISSILALTVGGRATQATKVLRRQAELNGVLISH